MNFADVLLVICGMAVIAMIVTLVAFWRARQRFVRALVQFETLLKQMQDRR